MYRTVYLDYHKIENSKHLMLCDECYKTVEAIVTEYVKREKPESKD